jgi:hypothetical protein
VPSRAPFAVCASARKETRLVCYPLDRRKDIRMVNLLLFIGIILLALWLVGLVSSYTLGGFIHVALIIGLIAVVVSLISRRRLRR